MTTNLPETISIRRAVRNEVRDASQVVGHITGSAHINPDGRPTAGLGLRDDSDYREVDVSEGDIVEFAGTSWLVSKVAQPVTSDAPGDWFESDQSGGELVAVLTRASAQSIAHRESKRGRTTYDR